jgi:hypothetical protein
MSDQGENLSEDEVRAVGDTGDEATPADQVAENLQVAFKEEWDPATESGSASADLDDTQATGSTSGSE